MRKIVWLLTFAALSSQLAALSSFNHSMANIFTEVAEKVDDPLPVRCYGIYGCFPITEPWACEQRAFNVFPFSPDILDVKFALFTSASRTSPVLIDLDEPETIARAEIDANHPIFVISHGFIELGVSPWIIEMTNALLDYDSDAAVMVVDWRGGSSFPYYQAVANTRVVGAVLAHTIVAIHLELGTSDLSRFHLIGHSLGAHVSGYAGYYVQRDFGLKIGRISGLDPAKPYFEFTHEIVRLDPSDADFVDVVHTDSGSFATQSFGLKQPVGHIDFYPNGGEFQPMCANKSLLDITCHHTAALPLYIESINTKCPYTGTPCSSYADFLSKQCSCRQTNTSCFTFGFRSEASYRRVFNVELERPRVEAVYLTTADSPPFCRTQSKVALQLRNSTSNDGDVGFVKIALVGSDRRGESIALNRKIQKFEAGGRYEFLVDHSYVGERIESVLVNFFHNLESFVIKKPQIFVAFVEVESSEDGRRQRVCRDGQGALQSYRIYEFRSEFCRQVAASDGILEVAIN